MDEPPTLETFRSTAYYTVNFNSITELWQFINSDLDFNRVIEKYKHFDKLPDCIRIVYRIIVLPDFTFSSSRFITETDDLFRHDIKGSFLTEINFQLCLFKPKAFSVENLLKNKHIVEMIKIQYNLTDL
jgi:hypothetical protein